MTTELQSRAPRRNRKAKRKTTPNVSEPILLRIGGKPCPAPGLAYTAFSLFQLADGSEIVHSNSAIARAGRCPHCFIDDLKGAGLIHHYRDEVLHCDFDLDGPRDSIRRNGHDLLTVLLSLGLPRVDPLNFFYVGGRA